MHPYYESGIYSSPAEFSKTARRMASLIRAKGFKFDAIAGLGNSGAPIAAVLALRLKKHLIIVRPVGAESHDRDQLCGPSSMHKKITSYIIVDDFVSSGATVNRIHEHVMEVGENIVLKGIFGYSSRKNQMQTVKGCKIQVPLIYS